MSATGSISGTETVSYRNCTREGKAIPCPNGANRQFTYPISLTGAVSRTGSDAKGSISAGSPNPMSGGWTAS
jgi:hypothetical protein